MATQPVTPADRLILTEDQFDHLRQLASSQNISLSEALARAIEISRVVVQQTTDPGTKVLFKSGNKYQQLQVNWR